jgi:hypothetical protein
VNGGLPLARLNSAGTRVICANCTELFAHRIKVTSGYTSTMKDVAHAQRTLSESLGATEEALKDFDGLMNSLRTDRIAVLDFLPGWVHSDEPSWPGGVWRMSKHARARRDRGLSPAFRRDPTDGLPPSKRDRTWRPGGMTKGAHGLPALIICPACKLRQIADPSALRCVDRW